MTILAIVFMTLGTLVAIGNIGGSLAAGMRQRRGESVGHSNVPLLSLVFCGLAWFLSGRQFGLWAFLPVVLDPATWSLVILPFFLLERRLRGASAEEPVSTAPQMDGLTGLPNQRALRLDSVPRLGIFFDIDDLASLNSYGGFAAGDEALIGMASIIERLARSYEGTAYRIGGDEFLVVLPKSATRHSALTLAHAVIEDLRRLEICDASLPPLSASAVIGRTTATLAERIDAARAWAGDELRRARLVGGSRGGVVVDTSDRTPNWA